MPKPVYLTRRRGPLFAARHSCAVCIANDPRPHGGAAFYKLGFTAKDRRPRYWNSLAQAYQHPNPLRANVTLWRCRRHARVCFVPLDDKQGLRGGVYR
jgi:hypothetical protein